MNDSFDMTQADWVVEDLVGAINRNREYLSEIDGAIGDGDHGINMSKGFTQCGEKLARHRGRSLASAFEELYLVLMEGIGGSMGPLYGSFFMAFGEVLATRQILDKELFFRALSDAIDAVQAIGNAKVGDKTLVDTLIPARDAYRQALSQGRSFAQCLRAMTAAAEAGMQSTKALQARIGRASRLGERSIGVLDAGSCSCFLILQSIAGSLQTELPEALD
ncbi:dihydroxyacetone kinase subunit DhaL [Herbaspirillum rhizosphaerae]|uniref:dihydroxyacetone kinase subunit DhaL n=1 Tax=Herbaspirillum rhizosphaerae TaxID=346179 RepID=UPI00067C8502|nr:dihydroxyacetone kinase subunit DhaL [Herbaspirillum rhizosphaerae]